MPARNATMKWIGKDILLNSNIKNHNFKMKIAKHFYLQWMGGWSESERISCQTQLKRHYLDSWGNYKSYWKNYICQECEDEVNKKGYLTKHQYQDKSCFFTEGNSKIKNMIKWKPKSV